MAASARPEVQPDDLRTGMRKNRWRGRLDAGPTARRGPRVAGHHLVDRCGVIEQARRRIAHERMSVALSICSASLGMTSLSQIPGPWSAALLNSPRTFDGASGLGSQMSMWLGRLAEDQND